MNKRLSKVFSLITILALMLMALPIQALPAIALSTSGVVISQVYGGGGNSGATYKNDFIELYNAGSTAVNLSTWSVQYAATTGSNWNKTNLTGTLQPGRYYLVQEAAGAIATTYLPTPDATGTLNMSATAGKVALVRNQTTIAAGTVCPIANIVDFVGFGTGTDCYEGSGPTASPSNAAAVLRNGDGSVDTDDNAADFAVGAPNPRNSLFPFAATSAATPAAILSGETSLLTVAVSPVITDPASTGITVSCNLSSVGGTASQPFFDDGTNGDLVAGDNIFSFTTTDTVLGTKTVTCTFADTQGRSGTTKFDFILLAIQTIGAVNGPVPDGTNGTSHLAAANNKVVAVQGVIYEKTLQAISGTTDTYKGFYIQNISSTADTDSKTSDGLFVFMGTADTVFTISGNYTPQVGDEVVITGAITEYFNMTELQVPYLRVVQVVRSGVDINSEVLPAVANPPTALADANRYWERLQGMRVQVPQNSIVLGGRNVFNPADAEIWLARSDSAIALRTNEYKRRAFRDAHPLDDNYDANNWDGNGYRMLIGSLGIKATEGKVQALIDPGRTFDTVTNSPAGGLNYTFSKYRIEITEQPTFSEAVDPAANNAPQARELDNEFTIADYNVENLYDYRDNPFSGCDFAGDTGCPKVAPFLAAVNPPYDYVPASDEAYQARLQDIAKQIIDDLHSPDVLMLQEVENQDICSVTDGAMTCGSIDNADGQPDDLQDLALAIAALGGPTYVAAFDRDSSDLRGIAPAFMYRTDRVELLPAAGDPVLGTNPMVVYAGNPAPFNADVSNPKTLNAVLPSTFAAKDKCETNYVFPRAPDIGLFRIHATSTGGNGYRDIYVINNHFKSGPDTCVAHRTEQAKYNAALVAFIEANNPNAGIIMGGDLNVYPRPDDPFAPVGQQGSSDQLGSLYASSLGLTNLWDVLLAQAPEAAYSYVYVGMAQTLDQMFLDPSMMLSLEQFRIAHINSDFPADYSGDTARGTSDHDPNVAKFKIFDWTGFLQPVDNLPELNVAKAGSVIPVKFSLNGDQGLSIFAPGYPISKAIACDATAPEDSIEQTVTAGSSTLQYDPLTDTYTYVWKTEKNWAGTCRQLSIKFTDGSNYQANFQFTK